MKMGICIGFKISHLSKRLFNILDVNSDKIKKKSKQMSVSIFLMAKEIINLFECG